MTRSPRESASGEVEAATWDARAALIGLMAPTIMWILDFSMIRVALPSIRATFGAQAGLVAWIVTVTSCLM